MKIPDFLKDLGIRSFVDTNKVEIQYVEDTGDAIYLCLHVSGVSVSICKDGDNPEVYFTLFPLRLEGGEDKVNILQWDEGVWNLHTTNAINGRENWIEIDLNQEGNFIKFHS
ncbi:MAG: hypothetical protein KAZ30_01750 [Candidatus Magasanikbacteria bacterium]|nr:hypothetical protein [Candidatus Magasanikbacteria bacterium]